MSADLRLTSLVVRSCPKANVQVTQIGDAVVECATATPSIIYFPTRSDTLV